MRTGVAVEMPPDVQRLHARAVRLEWFTLAYFGSAVVLLAFTLGSSQAMKAAWVEDILGLAPPLAFLLAARYRERRPNARFPYGYHRSVGVAYLAAALALLALGGYILYDSVTKLVLFEHPSIGLIELFGQRIWLGWLMIAALLYSGIPPVVLGRIKARIAAELHDKVLYADAEMNRADWLTAGAAIAGIVGIGFGLWWADALAATVISLDIVRDGLGNVRSAVNGLMDARPTTYDHSAPHPLPDRVLAALTGLDDVVDAAVRMREAGHVMIADAQVVVRPGADPVRVVQEAGACAKAIDWRVQEIVVVPVERIDEDLRGR